MHMILKLDLKMAHASTRCIPHYYWKMIADITKLVIIVNFPTSLVIQMACAGGTDL